MQQDFDSYKSDSIKKPPALISQQIIYIVCTMYMHIIVLFIIKVYSLYREKVELASTNGLSLYCYGICKLIEIHISCSSYLSLALFRSSVGKDVGRRINFYSYPKRLPHRVVLVIICF